jgi:predicted nucleic acid-binding protein
VIFLLDVSVLVAWGWADHVDHARAAGWIASAGPERRFLTSAIPQLGFVRVSVQRTGGLVTVADASKTLAGMIAALGPRHEFLADDQTALRWPKWHVSAARTTDARLLALATAHSAQLATLDTSIPGAFVLPASSTK